MRSLAEALAPPSLRFGLFDVVRQIGGADAEAILAESLAGSGRGLEVAYLTHVLEEMAPGKYKDAALAAARNLLASGTAADRDHLFGVLRRFGERGLCGHRAGATGAARRQGGSQRAALLAADSGRTKRRARRATLSGQPPDGARAARSRWPGWRWPMWVSTSKPASCFTPPCCDRRCCPTSSVNSSKT